MGPAIHHSRLSRRRLLGVGLLAAVAALLWRGEAAAEYRFCNNSSYALSAAIGYVDGQNLTTRGWWRLLPGSCKRILPERVSAGRYYVYAEAISGHLGELRTWSGRTPLCVTNDGLFTLRDQNSCAEDPRSQREFMNVDIGPGTDGGYTTEFTEEVNYNRRAAQVAGIQRLLTDTGYFDGEIDGALGSNTSEALASYARAKGLSTGAAINETVFEALIEDANGRDADRGFFLCNDTMLPVWSAFAEPGTDDDYRSQGWWRLDAGECVRVRRQVPTDTSYYVFGIMEAEGRSIPLAGGDTEFCIANVQFDARGDMPCTEVGYETASFRRIDTMKGQKTFKYEFRPEFFKPERGRGG